MLTILDAIGATLKAVFATPERIFFAAVLIILALAGGSVWVYRGERDAARAELAQERLDSARAQVKAVDDARIEEQRRTAAQTEIANVATKDLVGARADAAAANDVSGRLRQRVAELLAAGRAAGNPAPTGTGQAAGDPLDVLADVLGRADKRAGELAAYADAARIAGQACERAYDALMPVQNPILSH
ncbi:DUF2514 family protein [Cupriavidus sp. CV2]|uniref:DUF2514 family protein n=1 Tax=Cupriavidus ulmosensis TaxID=3065913 RepID=UPI00296AFCEC|nr:DUF2514 family protein [Cupriavidus sp. CV2]MDW3686568.1 DUF2514 family protein [Cupriavidus sp. CV2]